MCTWAQEQGCAPKPPNLDGVSARFCMKAFNILFVCVWGCSHDQPLDIRDLQEAELTQSRRDMQVAKHQEIQHFLELS